MYLGLILIGYQQMYASTYAGIRIGLYACAHANTHATVADAHIRVRVRVQMSKHI